MSVVLEKKRYRTIENKSDRQQKIQNEFVIIILVRKRDSKKER